MREVSEARQFHREKPPENLDQMHKVILDQGGERIGEARLEYRNQPFPFYYLDLIYIDDAKQGQGLGTELLEQVNVFLDEHKKPGLLYDAIGKKSPATGMYERHGWQNIEGYSGLGKWMGYHLEGVDSAQIAKAIYDINRRENRTEEKPLAA